MWKKRKHTSVLKMNKYWYFIGRVLHSLFSITPQNRKTPVPGAGGTALSSSVAPTSHLLNFVNNSPALTHGTVSVRHRPESDSSNGAEYCLWCQTMVRRKKKILFLHLQCSLWLIDTRKKFSFVTFCHNYIPFHDTYIVIWYFWWVHVSQQTVLCPSSCIYVRNLQ